MDARVACCGHRPSLDDLLTDEIMAPVLRSAGLDIARFREMLAGIARRLAEISAEIPRGGEQPGSPG